MNYPDFGRLLADVELPRCAPVRQRFPSVHVSDPGREVRRELARPDIAGRIGPGQTVCLCVGSRGIPNLDIIVAAAVSSLRDRGAEPFIVPAMGSHGGATEMGQLAVLAGLGITENRVGAPVTSSLDVIEIGRHEFGEPILVDRAAASSDVIVPINRIKPHTSFRGPIESGLCKMLAVGLGNHRGATIVHGPGFERMHRTVPAAARAIIAACPVAFGLAIIDSAYRQTARIEAIPAERILEREPELLDEARRLAPRILVSELDVLVVDRIGKDISGLGMDPAVTGRYSFPSLTGPTSVERLVALDLSEGSGGNACGVGLADIVTARLASCIDLRATYLNSITSTNLAPSRMPMVLCSDRQAVALAVMTCRRPQPDRIRLVRIEDTLHLDRIWMSQALLGEGPNGDIQVLGPAQPLQLGDDSDSPGSRTSG